MLSTEKYRNLKQPKHRSNHNGGSKSKQKVDSNRRQCAPIVERGNMHVTNVLPRMLLAIYHCKRKRYYSALCYAKTIAAVSSEGTATLTLLSSIQPQQTRKLPGLLICRWVIK